MQVSTAAEPTTTPRPQAPARRWWPGLLRLAAIGLTCWFGWHIVHVSFCGNVHAVIPGRLYRGGQPTAAGLESLVRNYGIRTVINVRGCCYPEDWFVTEAATCQQLGVQLENITFSAMHLPARDELLQLVDVLDRTEYPAFIHCRHGSDRTGVAAMIALLLQENQSYPAARKQLSMRYGHAPVGRTTNLDRFITLYENWLADTRQGHSPKTIRHWLAHEYRGGWCDAKFEKVERLFETARVGQSLAYRVTVRNTSNAPWQLRAQKTAGIHVTFKLMDDAGRFHCEERGALLDQIVPVGEKIQVTVVVPPIRMTGRYRLCLDMIDEGHCWFHQTGSEPWQEELAVRE